MMFLVKKQMTELEILFDGMLPEDIKQWMKKRTNKDVLMKYWTERWPTLSPYNIGEIAYCIKFKQSPLCGSGNHKKFKQFPAGYYSTCANTTARTCECYHLMRSTLSSNAVCNASPESKNMVLEKAKQTCIEKYGVDNPFKSDIIKNKIKNTVLERYGYENVSQIPEIKEKVKQTHIENYGVSHPRKAAEVINGTKLTCILRYGVPCALQGKAASEKTKATMLDKYGVENYFLSQENQNNIIRDRREKLGYSNPGQRELPRETLSILEDKIQFEKVVTGKSIAASARELNTSAFTISAYANKYNLLDVMSLNQGSVDQLELYSWLINLGVIAEYNTRKIIAPKEIDIYLPEYKLAIEYNGAYFHSEVTGGKDSSYHLQKLKMCREKGIELIQISSITYAAKPEAVKGILLAKLGKTHRIMARKCKIKEVAYSEYVSFLEKNHLQNAKTTGAIRYGLYFNDELVQVMSLGKLRKSLGHSGVDGWELIRLATKVGLTVTGGVSKLFTHFVKEYSPTYVVSYADLQYFTGNSLGKIGFSKSCETAPNYWYTYQYKTLEHRFGHRKQVLIKKGFSSNNTEWEIMKLLGYDRIWDCGNAKWEWHNSVLT